MDTTRVHRHRHARRRRLRPWRRGRRFFSKPAQRRARRCGGKRSAHHVAPGDAGQYRHRPRAALRDGTGIANRARDDGRRGNGGRLESRARQGSARNRRLCERVYRARVRRRFHSGAVRARVRLRYVSCRAMVWHAVHGRLYCRPRHRTLGNVRRRRGCKRNADRCRSCALRRERRRLQGERLTHPARRRRDGPPRLESSRRRRRSFPFHQVPF